MNLKKKKALAARTVGVGLDRIAFVRTDEIKEAITKQDIRDMIQSGAIVVKGIKGRMKKEKRTSKRGLGKIKKKIKNRKQRYMILTRKLREYNKQLMLQGKVSKEAYRKLRKQIKSKTFRSKSHFKELLNQEK